MTRSIRRITSCLVVLVASLATFAGAAQPPVPPAPDPELARLPLTHRVLKLARATGEKASAAEISRAAEAREFMVDGNGRINLEIINRTGGGPVSPALVAARGGEIDAVWRGQTSLWIDPRRVIALAEALPAGYLLREPSLAFEDDQGPVTVGTDSYLPAAGPGGQGIKVGIIDRNYLQLTDAETAGTAPIATRWDYTGTGFETGFSRHGTGHLETVFDHAPDAEYHIFKINSSTHLGLAVDDAITEGIHILSATQSFYNEGWEDDSGAGAQAAKEAADNGILYFSSAGNRATDHWQGDFDGWGGGTWLDWDKSAAEDWQNDIGDIADSSRVRLYLQWDRAPGTTDYDLYLYGDGFTLLDISQNAGETYESISWQNLTGATVQDVFVAVMHVGGPEAELEVFENNAGSFEHFETAGSVTSPSTTTAANVLDIAAVPFGSYSDGNLAGYSSRGPTNSGGRGIDLAGPTDTVTLTYPGGFGGTSCATPNAAGTAAALWSSVPQFSADGVRILLTHLALIYNDWGTPGPDPDYGYGAVRLPVHAANTEWIDPWAVNPGASPTLPWNSVSAALAAANVARIITMGGQYPGPYLLDDPVVFVGLGDDSVVGGTTP